MKVYILFFFILSFVNQTVANDSIMSVVMRKSNDAIFHHSAVGLDDVKETKLFILPKNKSVKYFKIRMKIINNDTIYFYTGLNRFDDKLLIIDSNKNKNFNDDKLYLFPESEKSDFSFMSEQIRIATMPQRNKPDTIVVRVMPYCQFYNEESEKCKQNKLWSFL